MQNQKNGTGRYSKKSGREKLRSFWKSLGDFSWVVISIVLTVGLIVAMALFMGTSGSAQQSLVKMAITDKFDMFMTNQISDAAGDLLSIEKVYWLNDDDQVAPEPNPACYGETDDPSTLGWLLEEAAELLDGQETLFSTDVQIMEGSTVRYYLDETIFAIVWKEAHTNTVYTHAEVKIAHPSQLRRFLAGGEYGSEKQFITTEMAQSVNAVLASSGDFYRFRSYGIIVYDGQVKRVNGEYVDTCMIDENGDMHLIYAGQITDQAAAQKYVDENNIRFSLAFGPVIIDGGKKVAISGNVPSGATLLNRYFSMQRLNTIAAYDKAFVTASYFSDSIPANARKADSYSATEVEKTLFVTLDTSKGYIVNATDWANLAIALSTPNPNIVITAQLAPDQMGIYDKGIIKDTSGRPFPVSHLLMVLSLI